MTYGFTRCGCSIDHFMRRISERAARWSDFSGKRPSRCHISPADLRAAAQFVAAHPRGKETTTTEGVFEYEGVPFFVDPQRGPDTFMLVWGKPGIFQDEG